MNRINPGLFAAAFADWVRESWPEKAELVAIDGKTSRRSHDRSAGAAPLHLVSAFATTARLVLARGRPCPTRQASSPPSRRSSNGSASGTG